MLVSSRVSGNIMTAQVNTRAGRLPYERGSEWRKWDLHIHTPGTGREDKFTGWPSFLQALKATKDVSVVGVTDYVSIANYEHLIGHKKDAKLGSIELLIPNIEFRVTPQTDKGHAVNLHLLIDPTESAHCDEINHALARLSIEYQRQPYSCTRAGITKLGAAYNHDLTDDDARYREEAQEPQGALRGRVLIVDEAGMVSGRQMQSLLHLAEDQGARIVFSGDTQRIPSVEASDALRILERESGLKSISLTEVQRQTNSVYREAVKTMRNSPEEGFAQLEKLGAIREISIFDRGQIVAELHREFRAEGRDPLVVAGTYAEISQLTDAIRQDRKDRGELGASHSFDRYVSLQWTTAQKQELSNYQEGQVLQFHRDTKLAKRHESLEVVRVGPESLVARKETGEKASISPKQTRAFSVYTRQPIEVAPGDSLMLTANRRGPELRATNGELVRVSSLDGGAIRLEDGRTLPSNYHEFTHGYAVTAHRSQGKTVDTVIISADAMKKELFYVAATRGRSEIAVVTSDREQLREYVGVSTMRQSAIELARKQLSAHDPEKGHRVDPMTGVNRQAGQQIGEQHSSVPTHTPEPEKTPHVGVEHDLGGPGLGLGL